ncbi:cytochrome P450 [Nocardia sp. SYP-A9097]|uniref:cytochrome P450 n=1 Tax=Nocardia sp. SYP-A9097 TaxID=2663237 RepID=UPI001E3CAC15|nr:cytochrome P450 [Nocardia sp. SYP-A9097]
MTSELISSQEGICPVTGARASGMSRTLTPTGDPAWLATGYHLVRELFVEPNLGRSHPNPETASRMGESAFFGGPVGNFASERADHLRMKSLLQPHFSVRRMREFQPRVEAITARLIDDMAAQGSAADLHTALAVPLPLLVICELLGVPYEDQDRFREWVSAVGNVSDRAKAEWGVGELFEYCRQSVQRKRRDPGDDVTSRLCADPELSEQEIATFAMMLLFAGHETSVVHIGVGVLMLLAEPSLWRTLHENPALLPTATEELLRACEPTNLPRYARTDLDVRGVRVAAGDLVLLGLTSANHDPTVFTEPSRVDFTRQEGTHFTFGYGARYCIGAPLARIELQAAFGQLVSRFPDMRLAVDKETLIMRDEVFTGGLHTLPVRW